MLRTITRLLTPSRRRAPAALMVTISASATRSLAGGRTSRSHSRQVVRVDESGELRTAIHARWRPFEPGPQDAIDADLAMFDGITLVSSAAVDTSQWHAIQRYGLQRYLVQAVAMRDFRGAISRLALDATHMPAAV